MGDYERPTVLQLPRLCDAETPEEFEELFIDEICNHHYSLPLDRLCVNGGAGDDVEDEEVVVGEFMETHVAGIYSFAFSESFHSGCRDIDYHETHRGTLDFSFDRQTGALKLSGGTSERVYESDEF